MTTEPSWARGSWMQTFTGRQFFPLDPHPNDVDPVDIAHALSLICRYGGHTRRFYSVAEHCVLLSYAPSRKSTRCGRCSTTRPRRTSGTWSVR